MEVSPAPETKPHRAYKRRSLSRHETTEGRFRSRSYKVCSGRSRLTGSRDSWPGASKKNKGVKKLRTGKSLNINGVKTPAASEVSARERLKNLRIPRASSRAAQIIRVAKRPYRRRAPLSLPGRTYTRRASKTDQDTGTHNQTLISSSGNKRTIRSTSRATQRSVRRSRVISSNASPPLTSKTSAKTCISTVDGVADLNAARKKHEAFVRAFAIPTHLYKYLAERHREKPLFLNRTLSYLAPSERSKSRSGPRPTINSIADRLNERLILNRYNNHVGRSTESPHCPMPVKPTSSSSWPYELEFLFDGFFDSEKELDWITVDASVNLQLRLGWAWRRKACPPDTLVSVSSVPLPLVCHSSNTNVHIPSHPNLRNGSTDGFRFRLNEIIDKAKWCTSGGRLTSGQLELRIAATEKRWLKRPNLSNRHNMPNGNLVNGSGDENGVADQQQRLDVKLTNGPERKTAGGLSSASYPVQYATAPLPLFYSNNSSDTMDSLHPLLLTPGLYELRLGVDNSDNHPTNGSKIIQSKIPNGVVNHDKPNCPNGLVVMDGVSLTKLSDQAIGVSDAGTGSGRVEWRRIRFPKSSTALDEYSRWPRIRFRVVWHSKPAQQPLQPSSTPLNERLRSPTRNADSKRYEHGLLVITSMEPRQTRGNSLNIPRDSNRHTTNDANPSSPRPLKTQTSPLNSVTTTTTTPLTNQIISSRAQRALSRPLSKASCLELSKPPLQPVKIHPITYCFMYGGHLQQWSESNDLICPWCRLNCSRARERGPEALLYHLRTCHPRFRFKATWNPARSHLSLEVSLNEAYDGSNDCGIRRWSCGIVDGSSARNLILPGQLVGGWTNLGSSDHFGTGTGTTSTGASATGTTTTHQSLSPSLIGATARVRFPVRRLPYTHLIFWRGAERSGDHSLDPTLSVRPMAVGHNRVYYHTCTVQPIRACEFEIDSESEDSPVWLCQHYQRKVEEFTDVNQGEKQMMQLWNSLLLSIKPSRFVVCDSQVLAVCAHFLQRHAHWIQKRRLRLNLLLHFVNLADYGLLSSGQVRQLMAMYDRLCSKTEQQQQQLHSSTASITSTTTTAATTNATIQLNGLAAKLSSATPDVSIPLPHPIVSMSNA